MIFAYEDYAERAAFQHARKLPFAIADRQSVGTIIPVEWNGRVDSFFVIVIIVFIFIEREVAVRPAINPKFNRVGRFLRGPLFVRPERKNRSGAHIERQTVQGRDGDDRVATFEKGLPSRSRTT